MAIELHEGLDALPAEEGALEMPTNLSGVIYREFNKHVKKVAAKLATRRKKANIEIDDALITQAAA